MQQCLVRQQCGAFKAHKRHHARGVLVRATSEVPRPALEKPELQRPDLSRAEKKITKTDTQAASEGVTVEYQRQRAKEMVEFFRAQKEEELVRNSRVFGWLPKNEIANGRWVMFGLAVGMLTEYATGVDLVNQIKLLISYLGIADIYD